MKKKIFILIIFMLLVTACKSKKEENSIKENVLTCTSVIEGIDYDKWIEKETVIMEGTFNTNDELVSYTSKVITEYKSDIDDETFNEYAMEAKELSSSMETTANTSYKDDIDEKSRTITSIYTVNNITKDSEEIMDKELLSKEGFETSFEKSNYTCK